MRVGLALALLILTDTAARAGETAIITVEQGHDVVEIAPEDILGVTVETDYNQPRVVVTLKENRISPLATFTMAHVKEEVVLKVCGQVVSRPTLWAPVLDGVFAIQGDGKAKAERLAEVLKTRDCAGMVG